MKGLPCALDSDLTVRWFRGWGSGFGVQRSGFRVSGLVLDSLLLESETYHQSD